MKSCKIASLLYHSDYLLDIDGLILQVMGQETYNNEEADYNQAVIEIINFLTQVGVEQNDISDIFSNNDELSKEKLNGVAVALKQQFIIGNLLEKARSFTDETYEEKQLNVEHDSMPPRKAGYKRKQVIRNGKKKWINKRNPNKKYRMSPKQKMALKKAQRKAHTGKAKINRAKSNRLRR